ncbi:hypothetical protein JSO54_03245 [Riemerella anatipestifer]|uniref:hypothetical protein n=1 Tax=Riemerella anatipestifer TaxID=34085 RepID=UPI0030C44A82
MLEFFEKNDPKYHRDFVVPNIKEDYHYIRTGIRANEETIKKYIVFLKELGGEYTWEHIRIAKSQLQVEEDGIKVKDDNNICLGNIVLAISLLFILAGGILFLYNLIWCENESTRDILTTVLSLIVPVLIGYFLMMSVRPILVAERMEEDLKKKCNNNAE